MNRSYGKIRHIQEANLMLEGRRMQEKSRQYLMEESRIFQTMTVKVPIIIDANKNKKFAASSFVVVSLTDGKGEGTNTRLGAFKSIQNLTLGGNQISNGRALTGFQYQFIASDQKLQNYLFNNIGKNFTSENNQAIVTLKTVSGEIQSFPCEVNFVENVIPAQK
jgi:hypothetical protein